MSGNLLLHKNTQFSLLAVFAATLLFLPWMMGVLIAFMTHIITSIPTLIH